MLFRSQYEDEVTGLASGVVSKWWHEYQGVVEVVIVDDDVGRR